MQVADPPMVHTRRWLRPVYFVLGVSFLVLGIIGVVLPLVPTTGPLLLAAFFFARSSSRLHRWLTGHPRFGRLISDFQAGKGIPMRGKVVAVVAMALAFGFSLWTLDLGWLRVLVALIGAWAITYVVRLPTSDRAAD